MVSYNDWVLRFPFFADEVSEAVFDAILLPDAIIEMGSIESRWLNMYDVAQANLIAHYAVIYTTQEVGDHDTLTPAHMKDVDGVKIESAVQARPTDLHQLHDNLVSTSYGQAYVKWRRMAFGGPRVA